MTIEVSLAGRIASNFTIDLAFEVPSTGVTALLGPSGSGKTTLLRALAGLVAIPGRIRVGQTLLQDRDRFVPPEKRGVGYVFQGQGLLPHLSVAGNLAYARRRAPSGQFAYEEVVAKIGLAGLLERMPSQLSGGEAQRASIARALLGQPRMLLMDEPLTGLDMPSRASLLDSLAEALDGIGIPIFYVTHDIADATRLADRMIRLRDGRLESDIVATSQFIARSTARAAGGTTE